MKLIMKEVSSSGRRVNKAIWNFSFPFCLLSIIIFQSIEMKAFSERSIVKHLYDLKILRWPSKFCRQIHFFTESIQFINLLFKQRKHLNLDFKQMASEKMSGFDICTIWTVNLAAFLLLKRNGLEWNYWLWLHCFSYEIGNCCSIWLENKVLRWSFSLKAF